MGQRVILNRSRAVVILNLARAAVWALGIISNPGNTETCPALSCTMRCTTVARAVGGMGGAGGGHAMAWLSRWWWVRRVCLVDSLGAEPTRTAMMWRQMDGGATGLGLEGSGQPPGHVPATPTRHPPPPRGFVETAIGSPDHHLRLTLCGCSRSEHVKQGGSSTRLLYAGHSGRLVAG